MNKENLRILVGAAYDAYLLGAKHYNFDKLPCSVLEDQAANYITRVFGAAGLKELEEMREEDLESTGEELDRFYRD